LKLICQIFYFAYKIQQNLTTQNGVETLEITPFLIDVARIFFQHTSMGGGRGAGILNSQHKRLFF